MHLSTHTAQIIDIAIATATASWLSPGEAPSRVHCSTKNLTQRFVQLAVRNSWLSSLLASLAWVMGHRSLHLATAPQRFASRWVRFLVQQRSQKAGCRVFAKAGCHPKTRQDVAVYLCAHKNIVSLLSLTLSGCHQAASHRPAERRCRHVERETGLEPATTCLEGRVSHSHRSFAANWLYWLV